MKTKKKTVFKMYDYMQSDTFAEYLSKMAAKGWHFKEWSLGLVFEQGEPAQTVYAVEVFVNGSEYDTKPEIHTEEFAEYCEAAGWKLIDAKRKFCIFKKVRDDAEDILTSKERLGNVSRETQKRLWYDFALAAVFLVLNTIVRPGDVFGKILFSNQLILTVAIWFSLFCLTCIQLVRHYIWRCQAGKRLSRGEKICFRQKNDAILVIVLWSVWLALELILETYTAVIIGTVTIVILLAFSAIIAWVRPDSDTNLLFQIFLGVGMFLFVFLFSLCVFFTGGDEALDDREKVSLFYEDYGDREVGKLEEVCYDGAESVFGCVEDTSLIYENGFMRYEVYRTSRNWILERVWEERISGKDSAKLTDCTEEWNAISAYKDNAGNMYVRYDDSLLFFQYPTDDVLTQRQVDIIREKLNFR